VAAVSVNDTTKFALLQGTTGNLQLVIVANDVATGLPNAIQSPQLIKVTRLFWSRDFTPSSPSATVSGLAVHPNLDLIVTSDATSGDSVYALFPDGPFHAPTGQHWSVAAGSVPGAAAIGSDDVGQLVYIASNTKKVTSVRPEGVVLWTSTVITACTNSASVVPVANVGGAEKCEAVLAGGPTSTGVATIVATCRDPNNPTGGVSASIRIGTANEVIGSSPITVSASSLYTSTDKSVIHSALLADGSLLPTMAFASSLGAFTGVLPVGGAKVVSGSMNDKIIYGLTFTGDAIKPFDTDFSTNVNGAIQGMPIFSSNSGMSFVTQDNKLHSISTTGADSVIAPVTSPGGTPLAGHDGITYLGRSNALRAVKPDGTLGWEMAIPGNVIAAPTLDCKGTLYVAAGNVVYAIITDMASDPNTAGLANTPWPKFQRDSRNTGNADITTKFGVRTASGPGGCIQ